MRCPPDSTAPPRIANWSVAAFDKLLHVWQHHVYADPRLSQFRTRTHPLQFACASDGAVCRVLVPSINAVPSLALSLPLISRALRAGGAVSLLHTGALGHPHVLAQLPQPSPRLRHVDLRESKGRGFVLRFPHFLFGFGLNGTEDWYPAPAYRPFLLASSSLPAPPRRDVVAWLSRPTAAGATRVLAGERQVVAALRTALASVRLRLQVVSSEAPLAPREFASLRGVVGVHGGAFANVHACRPGALVVEIQGQASARWCYAGLSVGLGLDYRAYFARRFPTDYMSREPREARVEVDPSGLAAFVLEAVRAPTERSLPEHARGKRSCARGGKGRQTN